MKIGIFSDIHENREALKEVLRLSSENGCDELVCLGDITGFDTRFYDFNLSRSAKWCVEAIMSSCKWVVAGNHDLFACGRVPSFTNGFRFPDSWFEMNALERKNVAGGKVWCYDGDAQSDLPEHLIMKLRNLPEYFIAETGKELLLFSHYLYPDFSGSTTHYAERAGHLYRHLDFMKNNGLLYSFTGHTHNHLAGFAYQSGIPFLKAFHTFQGNEFHLGTERTIITIPPVSGEKGRQGFAIYNTAERLVKIIAV